MKITTRKTHTGEREYTVTIGSTGLVLSEGDAERLAVDLLERVRVNVLQATIDRRVRELARQEA